MKKVPTPGHLTYTWHLPCFVQVPLGVDEDAGEYSNRYFAASLQLSTEVGNDLSSHGTVDT